MGRGIAVAITGITFDWKLGTVPWELDHGQRAPRMCEVQLSVTPIHDITPGLDHNGINRAPIYKVGPSSRNLTGDVWLPTGEYDKNSRRVAGTRDVSLGITAMNEAEAEIAASEAHAAAAAAALPKF